MINFTRILSLPPVGSFRRNIQLNEGNLFGIGDRISFAYTNTDGSNAIDTSYSLPLNSRNGTLNLGYGTTSSSVIEPSFDLLDIKSESRYYDLTLRQPIIQTPSTELVIGVSGSRLESELPYLVFLLPCLRAQTTKAEPEFRRSDFFKNGRNGTPAK